MSYDLAGATKQLFVGRAFELDELTTGLSRTLRGLPQLMLVSGEAGVGKTRLLRELCAIARHLGVRVVHGRAMEDASTPCLPFLSTLELVEARGHGGATDSVTPRSDDERAMRDRGQDRLRMFSIIQQIIAFAAQEPLLITLDDMQWADELSLDLLGQLVFAVGDASERTRTPLMLVAAHRPVTVEHRLRRLTERLLRESGVRALELDGLAPEETALLIAGLGFDKLAHPLVHSIQRVTHGYPLFVHEVLHQLARHARVGARTHLATTPPHFELPRDVNAALTQRLSLLDGQTAELLVIAAFLSDQFSLDQLVQVAQLDQELVLTAMERAMAAELVLCEGEAFRFRHPLIRELLVRRTVAARRDALHLQIAGALERSGTSGAISLEVARHLLAVSNSDHRRLLEHARRGADHAWSLYAWAEAARFYAAAATAASLIQSPNAREVAELHLQSALSYQHDFDLEAGAYHFEQAQRGFLEAEDLAGQAQTLHFSTLAQYFNGINDYGPLIDLSAHERVLAQLPDDRAPLRCLLLNAMFLAYWSARETERAAALAGEALRLAQEAGDAALHGEARLALGLVFYQRGQLHDALHAFSESFQLMSAAGDRWDRLVPVPRQALTHIALGQLADADQLCNEALPLYTEVGHIAEAAYTAANLAVVALARGEIDRVHERTLEALRLSKRTGWQWTGTIAVSALVVARTLQGRYDDARFALDVLAKSGKAAQTQVPTAIRYTARVLREWLTVRETRTGVTAAQRTRFKELALGVMSIPFDTDSASIMCAFVDGAAILGLAEVAESLHGRLERLYEGGMVLTPGAVFLIARVLGLSARLLGRTAEAERLFTEGSRIAEQIGAGPELAACLLDHACWLSQRDAAERTRGGELAMRAASVFARFRLEPGRLQALQTAARCGLHPSIDKPEFPASGLDASEVQLLRRIAHGRSHAEISRELLMAPERLTRLIEELFKKIEVDGPGLATAYSFARGIVGSDVASVRGPKVLMVTDMVDFTGLVQRVGDVRARALVHSHNRLIRQALLDTGGTEFAHTGDGVMASFDAADDALRCAVLIQRQLLAHRESHRDTPIHVRVGLNAGLVLQEEDRLFGAALIAAVRICSRAQPDQILLSASTHVQLSDMEREQAAPLGEVSLKGFASPTQLFAWVPKEAYA